MAAQASAQALETTAADLLIDILPSTDRGYAYAGF